MKSILIKIQKIEKQHRPCSFVDVPSFYFVRETVLLIWLRHKLFFASSDFWLNGLVCLTQEVPQQSELVCRWAQ